MSNRLVDYTGGMATKHEWKKAEKQWYAPQGPQEIEVPEFGFFVVEGQGDPNGPGFASHVELLYGLSYGLRMAPKAGLEVPGWFEYTVYPLEGVWDLPGPPAPGPLVKADLIYRLMIRQPDFVGEAGARILETVGKKKRLAGWESVRYERFAEGRCVQMLHLGPYDAEPATFRKMQDFCRKQSLARIGHAHREIYLSDARKTAPEDLRTILRFPVRDDFRCD